MPWEYHYVSAPTAHVIQAKTAPHTVLIDDVEVSTTTEEYDVKCFCVTYLREVMGIPIRGNAEDIIPNIDHPLVGGVILLDYDGIGHAGYISAILPSGAIYFRSANKEKCKVTYTTISRYDYRIKGFWFRNINGIM